MEAVLQPWVQKLPLKKQSAILSALRGPDHAFCREIKKVIKIIRSETQIDADPHSDYMKIKSPIVWKSLERELEFCSLHFVAHLIETLAILSPQVPEADAVLIWFENTFHLRYVK